MVIHYQYNFHKVLCKNMCTQSINVCVHVLIRALISAQIFTKMCLVVLLSVISLSLKFHKVPIFRCGDTCKN